MFSYSFTIVIEKVRFVQIYENNKVEGNEISQRGQVKTKFNI